MSESDPPPILDYHERPRRRRSRHLARVALLVSILTSTPVVMSAFRLLQRLTGDQRLLSSSIVESIIVGVPLAASLFALVAVVDSKKNSPPRERAFAWVALVISLAWLLLGTCMVNIRLGPGD